MNGLHVRSNIIRNIFYVDCFPCHKKSKTKTLSKPYMLMKSVICTTLYAMQRNPENS